MGLDLEYINGQTPIDDDENLGLLIPTISTRGELDEFEQQNIEEAMQWVLTRSLSVADIFTEQFVKGLHKKMYGGVWSWAGTFRKSNKNLGVDKWQIQTHLKSLIDDTVFWIDNETFGPDEIAIRFKHRIVSIHCFSNGNGRHSRMMADIIIDKIFNLPVFTWGTTDLVKQCDTRNMYIKAIRQADKTILNCCYCSPDPKINSRY
jgi:Fic-DOC domain mobile mystery protein B